MTKEEIDQYNNDIDRYNTAIDREETTSFNYKRAFFIFYLIAVCDIVLHLTNIKDIVAETMVSQIIAVPVIEFILSRLLNLFRTQSIAMQTLSENIVRASLRDSNKKKYREQCMINRQQEEVIKNTWTKLSPNSEI